METTLVLLKTDTVFKANIGKILKMFEKKGLKIVGLKMMWLDDSILKRHYYHVVDKPFFGGIVDYMIKCPIVALAISGINSVGVVRKMTGATNPAEANSGTIRGIVLKKLT